MQSWMDTTANGEIYKKLLDLARRLTMLVL
jgi:hypothetical protein